MSADRQALAAEMEAQIRPRLDLRKRQGGYDCCGCSTYDWILDHALAIVRGEVYVHPNACMEHEWEIEQSDTGPIRACYRCGLEEAVLP